jgi:hypothetical protein
LYECDTLRLTRRALVVLIALLYGARLDCDSISNLREGGQLDTFEINHDILPTAVSVCAVAEFWGCLDVIKPQILSVLKSSPVFWESVANSPEWHIALATKLEDAEIYWDALRHMIAEAHVKDDWEEVVNIMGWTATELRNFYKPQLQALGSRIQELREDLQTLQLVYTRARFLARAMYT